MSDSNRGLLSETHSGLRKQGLLIGINSVIIGDIIFALIYPIGLGIASGFRAEGFFVLFLAVAVISGITGLVVSIIPGGLGGLCLALLLNQAVVKGQLTSQKAMLMGALIGALAGIIACLISFLFLFGRPNTGTVFGYGMYDEAGYITIFKLALISVLPIAIAIIMGVWSGRRLARKLLRKQDV